MSVPVFCASRTAELLDFTELVQEIEIACTELADGVILAPERQTLDFFERGTMISMPATASDIGIHKLVNVMPDNLSHGMPTICGVVSVFDGRTGQPVCVLDGPTVTARRTAALSMLGIKVFSNGTPQHITMIGCGSQASGHAQALAALYPDTRLSVVGHDIDEARQFVDNHAHLGLDITATQAVADDSDVIITVTSSSMPVYDEPAEAGRLVVAVGSFLPEMAEIGTTTLRDSQLYIDEPESGLHEAGDYLQADVDWSDVGTLVDALHGEFDADSPIVFKTVGCAAWDLAAARAVLKRLDTR